MNFKTYHLYPPKPKFTMPLRRIDVVDYTRIQFKNDEQWERFKKLAQRRIMPTRYVMNLALELWVC